MKLKDGVAKLTLGELQNFLQDRLGKHECSRSRSGAALPKTPVGKISNMDLCEVTQAISCFYLFARSAAAVAMYFE
jgi:hypothetical protein